MNPRFFDNSFSFRFLSLSLSLSGLSLSLLKLSRGSLLKLSRGSLLKLSGALFRGSLGDSLFLSLSLSSTYATPVLVPENFNCCVC